MKGEKKFDSILGACQAGEEEEEGEEEGGEEAMESHFAWQ